MYSIPEKQKRYFNIKITSTIRVIIRSQLAVTNSII